MVLKSDSKENEMRRVFRSCIVGLAMLAGFWAIASAQGPGTAAPSPSNAPPRRSIEALSELRWLTQQLNVSPEQREKLRPIIVDEGEQLHDVSINERLSPDQKKAKVLEIR